jgi:hypothetical protein
MKLCAKCNQERPLEDFQTRSDSPIGKRSTCKSCKAKYLREQRAKVRQVIYEAKAHPCTDCGVQYPPWVMDFDHIKGKEFGVSRMVSARIGLDRIHAEIAKCELVCSNCHRQREHDRLVAREE